MLRVAAILLALCLVPAAFSAHAGVDDDFKAAQARLDAGKARYQADWTKATEDFEAAIAMFSRLIDSGQLNQKGIAIVSFYRGQAYAYINYARIRANLPPDLVAARAANADFQRTISLAANTADLDAKLARDAHYFAGAASNLLGDTAGAYIHWKVCAAREHAGCMNIMAEAYISGEGGMPIDLKQAIALHEKIVAGGTSFRCAGAYSAQSVARILHFTGVRPSTGNEQTWYQRAYLLLDALASGPGGKDSCGRAEFEIGNYLMRLANGESGTELLTTALTRTTDPFPSEIAKYFLGRSELDPALRAIAAQSSNHKKCSGYFLLFWHARLKGQGALAAQHHASLAAIDRNDCGTEQTFVRWKFKL